MGRPCHDLSIFMAFTSRAQSECSGRRKWTNFLEVGHWERDGARDGTAVVISAARGPGKGYDRCEPCPWESRLSRPSIHSNRSTEDGEGGSAPLLICGYGASSSS